MHCFFNHLTQFLESAAFGDDVVSQGRRDKAAINIVFLNLEDDFTHTNQLRGCLLACKPPFIGMARLARE